MDDETTVDTLGSDILDACEAAEIAAGWFDGPADDYDEDAIWGRWRR